MYERVGVSKENPHSLQKYCRCYSSGTLTYTKKHPVFWCILTVMNEQKWTTFDGGLGHLKQLAALAVRAHRLRLYQHINALQSMLHIHSKQIRQLPEGAAQLKTIQQQIDVLRDTL